MKKFLKLSWIMTTVLVVGALLAGSCSDSETDEQPAPAPEPQLVVALVDEAYTLDFAGPMQIRMLEFADGDKILFKQGSRAEADASSEEFPVTVSEITPTHITVVITPEIVTGAWSIYCRRGDKTQYLGTTRLEVDIFRLVRNVRIGESYLLDRGDRMTLAGEGFAEGDEILFSQAAATLAAAETVVTEEGIVVRLDEAMTSGEWTITCRRGSDSQLLGTTAITVTPFPAIDPAGLPENTNAYGRVYCGDRPLAGVAVSDGVEIVRTDDAGVYAMKSERKAGTLFVSLPAGYEAPVEGCVPQFWALFEPERDRYDFPLMEADQSNYVLLVSADIQIDNETRKVVPQSSLKSCSDTFVPAYRRAIEEYAGRKIYSVSLGDMVYDKFWYSRRFGLPEYKELIGQFGVPFFHIMGNHDNDPYCAGDFAAEHAFKEELGPTYYSLNIGAVHYVALDNIKYINTGGMPGIVGQTNYAVELSDRQIEWLKKDLAGIDKSTPVVVWMHAPLINSRALPVNTLNNFTNRDKLVACLEGYRVHVLSGHWHNNHTAVYPGNPLLTEHNVGSVCGALWHNIKGFNGDDQPFSAASDGSPAGFAVYEVDGTRISWHYRGCDVEPDVQFTAYDMNAEPYKDRSVENEILVNVWDWDQAWDVEVLENNVSLPVKHELREDPAYLRFMATAYAASGEGTKSSTNPQKTPHMFSAVASAADSPVEIRVTDRSGRMYTKQLRP